MARFSFLFLRPVTFETAYCLQIVAQQDLQFAEHASSDRIAKMNKGFNKPTPLSDLWETPHWLFDALDTEFAFTLDPCCQEQTAKCKRFYTPEADGLNQSWAGERVFINPPYSDIQPWVRKAAEAELAALLLPVRTDSDWFRYLIEHKVEIRFLRKRIKFLLNGREMASPRFPSLVAVRVGEKTGLD